MFSHDSGDACKARWNGARGIGGVVVSLMSEFDLGGAAGNPYAAAEAEARGAKRGIWRGTFERPSEWRQAHPRSDAN